MHKNHIYIHTNHTDKNPSAKRSVAPVFLYIYIYFYTSIGYIYGSRKGKKSVTPSKHKKKGTKEGGYQRENVPFFQKKKIPPLREKHQQKFHHKSHIVAGNKKESLRFFFHFPFPLLPRSLAYLLA